MRRALMCLTFLVVGVALAGDDCKQRDSRKDPRCCEKPGSLECDLRIHCEVFVKDAEYWGGQCRHKPTYYCCYSPISKDPIEESIQILDERGKPWAHQDGKVFIQVGHRRIPARVEDGQLILRDGTRWFYLGGTFYPLER